MTAHRRLTALLVSSIPFNYFQNDAKIFTYRWQGGPLTQWNEWEYFTLERNVGTLLLSQARYRRVCRMKNPGEFITSSYSCDRKGAAEFTSFFCSNT